jgi:rhodanese-related sulfurtransferase
MTLVRYALVAWLALSPGAAMSADLLEEITGYLDFASETEGIILPQQITQDVFENVFFVDARSAKDHHGATIPGAINIDWREIPGRLDELPETGMVVVFCNTGVRSSQAVFAARLLGHTNVLVMQSGFEGWLQTAGYRPE